MKLTARRNQCQGCKEYFNSTSAFDMHRTGRFGIDRRCMTPAEMNRLGMLVNSSGFWITEKLNGRINQDEPHDGDADEAHNEPQI
jgi:hypothetical protein